MWMTRLLIFILILALLPLLRRILVGLFAGLLGQAARPRGRCPRCGGSGWLETTAGMKKQCGCGAVPPEGRGPVIDVGRDRASGGRQ